MKSIRNFIHYIKDFFSRYPAVLSGYIIYCYLFFSIMRLFYKVKFSTATLMDAYDIFSALPFMWLLALSMVKVIEYRTKLHESEREQIARQNELELKEAQITTLHEVARGLQHQVNNPLAIISLLTSKVRREAGANMGLEKNLDSIEDAANKISYALEEFTRAERYEVNRIGSLEGKITALPKEKNDSPPHDSLS